MQKPVFYLTMLHGFPFLFSEHELRSHLFLHVNNIGFWFMSNNEGDLRKIKRIEDVKSHLPHDEYGYPLDDSFTISTNDVCKDCYYSVATSSADFFVNEAALDSFSYMSIYIDGVLTLHKSEPHEEYGYYECANEIDDYVPRFIEISNNEEDDVIGVYPLRKDNANQAIEVCVRGDFDFPYYDEEFDDNDSKYVLVYITKEHNKLYVSGYFLSCFNYISFNVNGEVRLHKHEPLLHYSGNFIDNEDTDLHINGVLPFVIRKNEVVKIQMSYALEEVEFKNMNNLGNTPLPTLYKWLIDAKTEELKKTRIFIFDNDTFEVNHDFEAVTCDIKNPETLIAVRALEAYIDLLNKAE